MTEPVETHRRIMRTKRVPDDSIDGYHRVWWSGCTCETYESREVDRAIAAEQLWDIEHKQTVDS